MRTVWKLAALTGITIPGLGVAFTCEFLARKLAGPLVGNVAMYTIAPSVILIATYICLKWFDRQPLAAVGIGFDRPWFVQLFMGIAAGALLLGACWVGLVVFAEGKSAWPTTAPKLPGLCMTLGSIFILGLCFYQELLCRGYVLQAIGRWSIKLAIVASGMLFVALHLSNPGGVVFKGAILTTEWTPGFFAGNEFGPEGGLLVTCILATATAAAWTLIRQRHPHPDLLA